MANTAKDIIKMIKDEEIEWVDVRFTDPKGKWQHLSMCAGVMGEDELNDGLMFDGSSIEGWKAINESDMILKPDLDAVYLDPFSAAPMLILFCNIVELPPGSFMARSAFHSETRRSFLKSERRRRYIYIGPKQNSSCLTMCALKIAMRGSSFVVDDIECLPTPTNPMIAAIWPPPARNRRIFPRRSGRQRYGYSRRDGRNDARNGIAMRQASP